MFHQLSNHNGYTYDNLESTLDKILNFMQTTTNNTKDSAQEDNTEANNLDINTVPPILPKGGVGE